MWLVQALYVCVSPIELGDDVVGSALQGDRLFGPDQDSSLPSYLLMESAVVSHRDAGFLDRSFEIIRPFSRFPATRKGDENLKLRLLFVLLLSASLAWILGAPQAAPVAAADAPTKPVDFNREIRPILSDNCFTCHGPDEKQRMANMRLDETEGLFVDRGGYKIITPGNAAQSKLYQKISSNNPAFRMPPVYSGRTLTEKQIELIKQWIDQGAKWETQWSFVAPKRPPVPEVKDKTWVRNPIDSFVLARLEAEGLKPSAGSRQSHPAAPGQLRLDRPAAYARRGRLLPGRQIARRL